MRWGLTRIYKLVNDYNAFIPLKLKDWTPQYGDTEHLRYSNVRFARSMSPTRTSRNQSGWYWYL